VESTTINRTLVCAKRAQTNALLILSLATVITQASKYNQVSAAAAAV